MAKSTAVHDDDVFAITDKGVKELKSADTQMSVAELQVLVLMDGFTPVAGIADLVPGTSRDEVNAAVLKLALAKYIVNTVEPESDVNSSGFSTITVPAGFFSSLKSDSSPEAEGGASILKQKGYYVRIARRHADAREHPPGWRPTVLVIDDDIDLQKLIRTYFVLEGFVVRAALKRDDISIALRMQPVPDLVLLDVHLPDADGFDILARMRHHPVLKTMPVIMLTAEATREAVLRGLKGGADGYVTKPFEADVLVTAVKAVLGLSAPPEGEKSPQTSAQAHARK
ncbi:MAG: response regulator transcription factor [Proteobacteria bacterium]|nr:response regulator transcription factor [Pseudomonadota bacterium]